MAGHALRIVLVMLALAASTTRAGFDRTDPKTLEAGDWSAAAPRVRVGTLLDDKGEGWLVEVTDSTLVVWIEKGDLEHWAKREPWEHQPQPFLSESEREAENRHHHGSDDHWRSRGWIVIPRDRVLRLEIDRGRRKDLAEDRREWLEARAAAGQGPPGQPTPARHRGRWWLAGLAGAAVGAGLYLSVR